MQSCIYVPKNKIKCLRMCIGNNICFLVQSGYLFMKHTFHFTDLNMKFQNFLYRTLQLLNIKLCFLTPFPSISIVFGNVSLFYTEFLKLCSKME